MNMLKVQKKASKMAMKQSLLISLVKKLNVEPGMVVHPCGPSIQET
jgi:hypothetical protein